MRILVVEDFAPLREALTQGLTEAGYTVDTSEDGEDGLLKAQAGDYDVIILDLMLPKLDGTAVLQALRKHANPAHVLVLTAKGTPEERIRGLDLGADDYMTKPFIFGELLARVRALVRRKATPESNALRVGDLKLDLTRRTVFRAGAPIELSGREYALLEYLALNANRVVTRGDIVQHVYDFKAALESNVIDVFIGLLRKKIERPGRSALLHTKRGQGYMLADLTAAAGNSGGPPAPATTGEQG
jgi:DNA-binding response OmpR family regulator